MKKPISVLLAFVLAASSLAGCGSSSSSSGSSSVAGETSSSAGTPAPSGSGAAQIVNVPMTSDPDTLDPGRADDEQKNAIVLEVQEGLVRLINGTLEPAGAEKWETSEDGLVWTFHLRENKYNDGTPVVAQDFVNSVRRVFDPEVNSHNAGIFYCIKGGEAFNKGEAPKEDVGVKAIDEKTLEFTLVQPLPYFLQLLTFANITPVPESLTQGEKNASYGATPAEMLFSGPFMVESWTRGSGVVLKKNTQYWDAANVKLDTINMILAQDETTREQLFISGQIDIYTKVRTEFTDNIKPKIDSGEVALIEGPLPRASYICFNNNDPEGVFTNQKIRRAFSIALDREAFVNNVWKKEHPAYGWIPYGLSNGDVIFRDAVPEPMKEMMSEDPKALFEEGLKEIGKEGQQLTITFLQRNSDNESKVEAEYYQNQWQTKLGVVVKIDTASDSSAFNNQVSKGQYQVCRTGWGGDYNDPMTFMQCFMTGDGNNPAFFSDARYDELITACMTEKDMAVRQKNFAEAERILTLDKNGIAPTLFSYNKNVASGKLKGFTINGAGGPAIEFKNAYME